MLIMQAISIQICLLDKNMRYDHSQGYIQDLSLGWVNVWTYTQMHKHKSIVTQKHHKKLSNWVRFVVYLHKYFVKIFHKLCYINIEREIIILQRRASSPKKIWQMMQFGEFWSITKTLPHRIQFIIKQRMVIQLHICYVCLGACSLGKY